MAAPHVIVVGAGIFGASTALELNRRGYRVTLMDQGTVPHPLAASTDISKVIRLEYGPDETYMALMEQTRDGWLAWNEQLRHEDEEPLFHETGVMMVCRDPMADSGFEHESWRLLLKRGHHPERLNAEAIAERFPAWNTGRYIDGFYHAKGGYAESGRVIEALVRRAQHEGVTVTPGRKMTGLIEQGGRVTGVRDEHGEALTADEVVLATGAWTGKLLPELGEAMRPAGQAVFHLEPENPALFEPGIFPTFTADIARTGYYGFPLHREGVVKIASHGVGVRLDPDAERRVTPHDFQALRAFLEETFPALLDAEVVYTRLCLYTDTQDEHFWIARDPDRTGLTVASGGSGHGFKFGPVLGALTADAMEGKENPWLERFRWRGALRLDRGEEAARYRGLEN